MTTRNKGVPSLGNRFTMFVLLCASLSWAQAPQRNTPPPKFPGIDATTSASCGYLLAGTYPFDIYDPEDHAPRRNRLRALWIDPQGLVHAVADTASATPKNSSHSLLIINTTTHEVDASQHAGDFDSNLARHGSALIKVPDYLEGADSVLATFSDPQSKGDLLFYDRKTNDSFRKAFLRGLKSGEDYELPYPANVRQFFPPRFFYAGPTLMMAGVFRRGEYLNTYVMRILQEPQQRPGIKAEDLVVLRSFDRLLYHPPTIHWTVSPSSPGAQAQLHVFATDFFGLSCIEEYTIDNSSVPYANLSRSQNLDGLSSHYSVLPQSDRLQLLTSSKDELFVVNSHNGSFRNHPIDLTPLYRIAEVRHIREFSWHSYSTLPMFAMVRTMGRENLDPVTGRMISQDSGLALVIPGSQAVLAYFPLGEAVTNFPMAVHIDPRTGQGTVAFTRNGISITVHHFQVTTALWTHYRTAHSVMLEDDRTAYPKP